MVRMQGAEKRAKINKAEIRREDEWRQRNEAAKRSRNGDMTVKSF